MSRPLSGVLLIALIAALTGKTLAQSDRAAYCDEFAEAFAQENYQGDPLDDILAGAADGAVYGRITRGRKGSKRWARIGGTLGSIDGGLHRKPRYERLYRRAFATCMSQ